MSGANNSRNKLCKLNDERADIFPRIGEYKLMDQKTNGYDMKRLMTIYIFNRKKALIIIALIIPLVFLFLLILNLFHGMS